MVTVIRSRRKSLAVEVKSDASVVVRAPLRMPEGQIRAFLAEKADWIEKHVRLAAQHQAEAASQGILTPEALAKLKKLTRADLLPRAERYAEILGVTFGKLTVRAMHTRWGSCSSRGDLSFNCLLLLMPPEVRDYVVVHELCHRKQMDHSPRFWAEVARILPDHDAARRYLREHGPVLLSRLP